MCFIRLYNICEQIDKCLRNKYKNVKNVVKNRKFFHAFSDDNGNHDRYTEKFQRWKKMR